MFFKVSWDEDFDTLMMHLWSKYGKELFTLDGIGSQMDLHDFSKKFFNNKTTTADVSVDANANVVAKTGIEYNYEMSKPLKRYNSYFLLWKELKRKHGLLVANNIIEAQLTGDIYINDFSDIASPYSYWPGTTVIIRHKGAPESIQCTSLRELFLQYAQYKEILEDRESIDLSGLGLEIYENQRWVSLNCVLRHINDKPMHRFETKHGSVKAVTFDHPCILEDMSEITAENLQRGAKLLEGSFTLDEGLPRKNVGTARAYLIGALVGDGSIAHHHVNLHQKDVANTNFTKVVANLYPKYTLTQDGRSISFGGLEDADWYRANIGANSRHRKLPSDFLLWDTEAQYALLAGVIDTDGTVNNHTGVVDIRVISLTLVQQVYELAKLLGFARVRTSLVNHYPSKDVSQKQPLYRVSFSIPEECAIIGMSTKLTANRASLLRFRQKDGRFETNEVHKLDTFPFEGEYVYDVTTSSGRFYSNGLIVHNCFNYSTLDIALNGLKGISQRLNIEPPKSLATFLRQVEQFIAVAANSTLGATGLADLLLVSARYVEDIQKTGKDGHIEVTDVEAYIREQLTSLIYTLNWPFRTSQSPFSNVSLYDDTFLDSLCPDYGASKGVVKLLQRIFVSVMNAEMRRTPLTFPVTTACFATDDNNEIADKAFLRFIAETNREFGFINLYNGNTASLSSCCRLRSNKDNQYFNSFGAGSTKIGSLGVVTANLPRAAKLANGNYDAFMENVHRLFVASQQINACKRRLVGKRIELGAAPLYTHGYMALNKQYSTFGIVGLNEAVELMGKDILSEDGQNMVIDLLDHINAWIDQAEKEEKAPHNVEQVPAESSAVKLAQKDKMLGMGIDRPLYSNQFIPLTTRADMFDRLRLQGMFDSRLSGGAIAHINVGERIDPATMVSLMEYAAKAGVVYWAVNYLLRCCPAKHTWVGGELCPTCGQSWESEITRVVGFFTTVKNWNPVRREQDWPNRQFYTSQEISHV